MKTLVSGSDVIQSSSRSIVCLLSALIDLVNNRVVFSIDFVGDKSARKMSFFKQIWKMNSKHKKLSEDMVLQQKQLENTNEEENNTNSENDNAVVFKLKYLGSSIVEKVSGENISVEAVKGIIKFAKVSRKIQSVNIAISLKGITVRDLKGDELLNISIYRISNCSTDPSHRQIFSFVSTDAHETTECHAFLCTKRRTAETVTLAVAHAFSTAYEAWRILPSTVQVVEAVERRASLVEKNNQENARELARNQQQQIAGKENQFDEEDEEEENCLRKHLSVERLIDLGDDEDDTDSAKLIPINTCDKDKWVSFEEDFMIQGFSALS